MKKMIMMLAAVAMVGAAQAAAFNWVTEWTYSTNPNGSMNTTFFNNGTTAGTAWLVALAGTDASAIQVNDSGTLLLNGAGTTAGTFTFAGGPAVAGSTTVTAANNGASYALIVYDSATGMYGRSNVYQLSGVLDSPPNTVGNTFSNDGGSNPDSIAYMAANLVVVPEPTSMALLALGVAALGLRRKFRK